MYSPARLAIILCALCAPATALAQPMEGGARIAALGGAGVALPGDAWSRSNPAARGSLHGPTVAFFASQGYGMAELRFGAATVAVPTGLGTLALGAQTFGFEEYRENVFSAGVARGFGIWNARRLYGGIDVQLFQVQIPDYGSAHALALSLGLLAQVLPDLWVGMAARGLSTRKPSLNLPLDRTFALGFLYEPDARLRLLADAGREIGAPFSFRSGVELSPVEAVAFRAGISTAPTLFSVGAGIRTGILAADVAAQRHEVLGWTPGLSVEVAW
ncbi:MAG TPA: hypothetical protein VFG50_04875 [Rhodothermales bacterium]|nr:hypothetical protein [Rhodothermales bacterium]